MFQNLQPDIKRQRKFRLITLLISIIGICFVLEISGHFRLQFALKKELPVEVMKKMIDWVDYFHHHRGAVWLSNKDSPQSLVFEIVIQGDEFILLQGDSWIERIETNFANGKPKKNGESVFFNALDPSLKSLGYINAGIGSFSPSLAEGQLQFLKKNEINPKYIVLYIDQTDFGDELFRYSQLIKRDNGAISSISEDNYFQFKSQYKEIVDFYDSNIKAIGFIRYEITKIFRKLKKDENIIDLDKILSPLSRQLSEEENEKIKESIRGYINEALKSNKLEKLLIVTHPHLKHLDGVNRFTNQMHDFVLTVLQELNQDDRSRVCITKIDPISTYQFKFLSDVFFVDDPTSHLKPEYQTIHFPMALAKSLNACLNIQKK